MSSSISNSEIWRRFGRIFLLHAAGFVTLLYAFVVIVDPWDMLPLSPSWPRVPISSNARYSFPALAKNKRFDSAVLGTSTARLLQPSQLDPAFSAHFVNLAMNSATAWEQVQLLAVFLRAHPRPRAVLIDIDAAWCAPVTERLTPRSFPTWMYGTNLWLGYRDMLTPYAVQEAFNQAAVLLHLKRPRYGLDGYTRFVPPDSDYDPVRVDAAFARWPPPDQTPVQVGDKIALPGLDLLPSALQMIPDGTRVVLFFPPLHAGQHGNEGSRIAARWAACKQDVARIAGNRAELLDFLFPNAITSDRSNYWDPLHYRERVASRLAARLNGTAGPEVRRIPTGS